MGKEKECLCPDAERRIGKLIIGDSISEYFIAERRPVYLCVWHKVCQVALDKARSLQAEC